MAILNELSSTVKRQRSDMGLSQERLAELSGLSRATIAIRRFRKFRSSLAFFGLIYEMKVSTSLAQAQVQ